MLAPPTPPQILLAENEDGDGFCVTVLPPQPVGHDRCFVAYLDARAYARLLRFGHGWLVVDRCDVATRKLAGG